VSTGVSGGQRLVEVIVTDDDWVGKAKTNQCVQAGVNRMRRDFCEVPNESEGLDGGVLTGVRRDVWRVRGGVGPPEMGAGELESARLALSHRD